MTPERAVLAGRYRLEQLIARGGMATVHRAHDDVLDRPVAIKVLFPHLARDESFLARFQREAIAAARLAHPNVVAIYDTGNDVDAEEPRHYIVMELCPGGTLRDLAQREGPLDGHRVAMIGAHICDALAYADANGVVHRDVKPGNVLIAADGTVKVGDFGIAKAAFAKGDVTTTGAILGTVAYISPEQAQGDEPDARSDLYSLGALLYELLVGRPPFAAESPVATAMHHINDPPPPPRSIRAGVPRALEDVILRALSKDPAQRQRDAAVMRDALLRSVSRPFAPGTVAGATGRADAGRGAAPASARADYKWLAPVLLLGAVAVAAILLIDASGERTGGDGGGGDGGASRRPATVEVADAYDFDPYGGDGEHPELVDATIDGDAASEWTTSSYNDPLPEVKPGVGLLFDLGDDVEVAEVEIVSPTPGYAVEIRAGDRAPDSEQDLEEVAAAGSAQETYRVDVDRAARYWLIWITGFPGGAGGSAEIAEVRFVAG